MRITPGGPISLRMTALAGVILICGYALVRWMGHFNGGPGDIATPPPPRPGVVDPLNRAILIGTGTFIRYLRSGFESEDVGFRVVWPVEGRRDWRRGA